MALEPLSPTQQDAPEGAPPTPLVESQVPELVEYFCRQVENHYTTQEWRREKWRKWLRAYDAEPVVEHKTFPWEGASNVVVGLIPIQVDQIVARIMQAVFSNEPHWVGKQLNRGTAEAVKPLENWLDWIRQHMWDQYAVVKCLLLECAKLGTAVLYNGWQDIPVFQYDQQNRQTVEVGRKRGPLPQWVPLEDFLVPEGFIDHQTAPWVARRWWISKQQYLEYCSGEFFELHPEIVEHRGDTDDRIRREEDQGPQGLEGEVEDSLLSIWQVHFNRDLDNDGFPEAYELWLHLDTKLGLRFGSNLMLYGLRPYVKFTLIEMEGSLYGKGVPEMIFQYQEEASTIHNQRRDNATIGNIKMVVARRGSQVTSQKLRPGGILYVTDPKDISPFSLGEVNPSSLTDEQIVTQLAQQRVGTNDVNMGNITPAIGRATASTVLSQIQEGTRRFDLNTSELRRALSQQANQIIELYQLHGLPEPTEPGAPEMILDPEPAAIVRALITAPDRIEGLIALQLNVSTAAVNKEIEKQSTQQLMQTVVQGYYVPIMQLLPQLAQAPPPFQMIGARIVEGLDKLMKNVLQAHQRFDLETVLLGDLLPMLGMGGGMNGAQTGATEPETMAGGGAPNNGAIGGLPM